MTIATILTNVSLGRDLSPEEFCFLWEQGGRDDEILHCANEINREINGERVTFVYNRNINYTNICKNHCTFCGFRRDRGDKESYLLSVDEILEGLTDTPLVSEVCIQGGLYLGLEFSYIQEMLCEIKACFPSIHIHAFSPMEIYYFSKISGRSLTATLESLMKSGVDSMPGTAAEILDDGIRQKICPEKIGVESWIEVVKKAHTLGLRSTATIMFGHIESPVHLAQHLEIIRNIQYETRGFTEFVPLPFVPFRTALAATYGIQDMLPFDRVRLFHALCRLFFRNSIPHIQASWPKLGLDRALECTFSGVDDVGGTLYQENITRSAGGDHGERVLLSEFHQKISKIGKVPQLRTTLYDFLDDKYLFSLLENEQSIEELPLTEAMVCRQQKPVSFRKTPPGFPSPMSYR